VQYDEGREEGREVSEHGGRRGGLHSLSHTRKLQAALVAEFIGMTVFQIYGGNAPNSVAAFGNGITLVVLGDARVMTHMYLGQAGTWSALMLFRRPMGAADLMCSSKAHHDELTHDRC